MTPTLEERLTQKIDRVAGMVQEANRIVVFTGAGISTESGIPDFRSPGGTHEKYPPVEFGEMIRSEEARERYWLRSRLTYPAMASARPNAAHLALVELEMMGKLSCVVTQNIDGLHQTAGCSPEKVIELHGTTREVVCFGCDHRSPRALWQPALEKGLKVPVCPDCGGILKVATVSFGQALPREAIAAARKAAVECDLMLAVGSSLVVSPACYIPQDAVEAGARLVIVNPTATGMDRLASVVIRARGGEVLPRIVEGARRMWTGLCPERISQTTP